MFINKLFLNRKVVDEAKVNESFAKTPLGKKLHKASIRKNLTDFDRFKVMLLKKKVGILI